MQLEKILKEYGLKEKQAKVYLACLQVGSGPVLRIAERAGLARSSTELVLKSLQQKGLISSYFRKSIKHFSAEDPHKIVASLKERTEMMEEALPKFMAMYRSNETNPSVRFYEGTQAMKLILGEILTEATELLCFASADDLFATIDGFSDFVQKRIQAKIPLKVILKDSAKAQERQRLGPQELRAVKLISGDYDYHGLIYIWKNKIAMFSFADDLSAILIESKELAQVQRNMFIALWDSLA